MEFGQLMIFCAVRRLSRKQRRKIAEITSPCKNNVDVTSVRTDQKRIHVYIAERRGNDMEKQANKQTYRQTDKEQNIASIVSSVT